LLAYRRDELRKPKSLFGPSPPDTDYVSNGGGFLLMAGTGFADRKKMRETSSKDRKRKLARRESSEIVSTLIAKSPLLFSQLGLYHRR
jgi:hypothetical protein